MDKLLEIFIKEPEKYFHVRQISKMAKKSPTTISKYLKNFEKKGILKSEKKLNHLLFSGNNESREFKQLKLNYNLNNLFNSGLIDYLVKEFNYPEAIILFGSFSKAEDILRSDIDLLVVSPSKKKIKLELFEKKLGKEIQIFVYPKEDIKKMQKTNKGLMNNLVNGIIIYGFWEVFK
jgi:DNA-binding Lrp family transcriptional regulator